MRHLLALLGGGTRGTLAEPASATSGVLQKSAIDQLVTTRGTAGTLGTCEFLQRRGSDNVAERVGDLVDAWHERMAICLETGDISGAEAETTAALEVGWAFVLMFVREQQEGPALISKTSQEVTRLD